MAQEEAPQARVIKESELSEKFTDFIKGEVDTSGGDFIGRDQYIFTPPPTILDKEEESILIERERLNEQIKRLRGRVTRLIPAIEWSDLLEYSKYRYEYRVEMKGYFRRFLSFLVPSSRRKLSRPLYVPPDEYLTRLTEIETKLSAEELDTSEIFIKPWDDNIWAELYYDESVPILQALNSLSDKINVRIARLNSRFIGYVNQSAGSGEFLKNQITKIGHAELRNEAQTHCDAITPLIDKIDPQELTVKDFDVLGDEAYAALSIMVEIENRKNKIERLIEVDRRRRNITVLVVIAYIAIAIGGTIYIALRFGSQLSTDAELSELRMPLIGVPWPVIVWALIGSFAAMIHRFNKKPIHDFGDAIKWMLTRPVQGVVLGAAFYLVVISGLFLFTGFTLQDAATSPVDEVILILAFLVGFSDRFADSVFNTLMQSFSKPKEPKETENETEKTNEE